MDRGDWAAVGIICGCIAGTVGVIAAVVYVIVIVAKTAWGV